jgi:hypothetical protein
MFPRVSCSRGPLRTALRAPMRDPIERPARSGPWRSLVGILLLAAACAVPAQPTDGVYAGRTRQGRSFSVTVSNGNVTSYAIDYFCSTPNGTIVSSGTTSSNTSCPISNGSFTCGNASCIPAQGVVTASIEGRFDGTHVSGTFLLSVGGAGFCACGLNPTPFNADLGGSGGTTIFGPNASGLCSSFSRPSQFFADSGAAAELADDVVVPAGQTYVVSRVWAHGSYSGGGGPIDGVDVKFLADAGGNPGALACGYTALVPVGRLDVSDFVVDLPTACRLGAGTWWLSVQARMPFNPRGQWFWAEASGSAGSGYRFQDTTNALGTGCTSWNTGPACFEPDPVNANTCFLLKGVAEEGPLFRDGFEDPGG